MNAAAAFAENGTANADTAWVQTAVNPTIGTTSIAFIKFTSVTAYTFNNGLQLSGSTVNVVPGDSSLTATPASLVVAEDPAGAIVTGGSGIKSNLESSNPTLQISSNQLGVKLNASGAIVTSSGGIEVQLESSNPTLQISSNQLGVKLNASGAIVTGASGLSVQLESSNPSLQISSDAIGVKLNPSGAIVKGATGVAAQVDASTITINGSNQLAVPSQGITATQLATSVAGSGLSGGGGSALTVQTGDGVQISSNQVSVDYTRTFTNDNASAITVGQVAYVKSNGNVDLAIATISTLDQNEIVIVSDASISSTASGKCYTRVGAIIGGFSSLTPGQMCYVSNTTAGTLTQSLGGWSSGQQIYAVGRAVSTTQIEFDPAFILQY